MGWLLSRSPKATCLQSLLGGRQQFSIMKCNSLNSKEDNNHFFLKSFQYFETITTYYKLKTRKVQLEIDLLKDQTMEGVFPVSQNIHFKKINTDL